MVAAAVWSGPPGTSVTGDCMAACAPDLAPLRVELTWWTLPLLLVAQDRR